MTNPEAEAAALIGQVIDGRYRIVEVIGEGGMGRVYRAEQERLKRSVAIKVLQRDYSVITEVGQRFEREAIAIARLDHPNCVAVQDFGRLPDGSLYLVMSLLEGTLLRDAMTGTPLPIRRALHVTRHLLSGLAHAHAAGIVHRDVKPDNVMLVRYAGDADFAKLFDFGIAKLLDSEAEPSAAQITRVGQRFGTPAYMSPEQALGKPLDTRTDLYSVTIVLYEMLVGRPPFEADDPAALLVMHAAKAPPTLSEARGVAFPEVLEALVTRGLVKDPAQRYASAGEYLDELDRCVSALANPAAVAATLPAARAPRRSLARRALRSRRVLGSVAGLLLLAGAAFGIHRALRVDHVAHARALLAGGRPQEAAVYLEEALNQIADDGQAQLQLGHAYAALRRYDDALVAYERVRSLDRSLAGDRTMRTNLMLMLDDERNETATGAARFLIQLLGDEDARARVAEIASRYKSMAHRDAMRDLAEGLGLSGRIDRIASYSLDLEQGTSCAERQRAVAKLRALADPAAVAALKSAQARKPNLCLRDDAADAIRYLESLPSGEAAKEPHP